MDEDLERLAKMQAECQSKRQFMSMEMQKLATQQVNVIKKEDILMQKRVKLMEVKYSLLSKKNSKAVPPAGLNLGETVVDQKIDTENWVELESEFPQGTRVSVQYQGKQYTGTVQKKNENDTFEILFDGTSKAKTMKPGSFEKLELDSPITPRKEKQEAEQKGVSFQFS